MYTSASRMYRTDEIQRGSSINDPKFTRNRILRDSARLSLCQYVAEERRSFFELPNSPRFVSVESLITEPVAIISFRY